MIGMMVLQNKFNCKVTKKVHIKFDRQKLQLHILSMPITISFMKQLYCKQLGFLKFFILQVLSGLSFFAQQH